MKGKGILKLRRRGLDLDRCDQSQVLPTGSLGLRAAVEAALSDAAEALKLLILRSQRREV